MSKTYCKLGALLGSLACLSGMPGSFVSNASTLFPAEYSVSRSYSQPSYSYSNSKLDVSGLANSARLALELLQLLYNKDMPGWLKGIIVLPCGCAVVEMISISASGRLFLTPKVVRALGGTWEENKNGNKILVSETYNLRIKGTMDAEGNFYPNE